MKEQISSSREDFFGNFDADENLKKAVVQKLGNTEKIIISTKTPKNKKDYNQPKKLLKKKDKELGLQLPLETKFDR